VRLYVDGIPATLPDGQGQTSNIDIGSVDRVEVLRGPFSALYGNSSGGVLQAFTASGEGAPRLSYSRGGRQLRHLAAVAATERLAGRGRLPAGREPLPHRRLARAQRRAARHRQRQAGHCAGQRRQAHARCINSVRIDAQDPLGLTADQYALAPRNAPLATQYDTRKTVEQTQVGLLYERRIDATQGCA
jgi:iron complex outermembrane receptor protein